MLPLDAFYSLRINNSDGHRRDCSNSSDASRLGIPDTHNLEAAMSDNVLNHEMDALQLNDACPSTADATTISSIQNINRSPVTDAELTDAVVKLEEPPTFTSLPVEILRRIFDFLLTAKYVLDDILFIDSIETKKYRTTTYEFQFPIMLVNRAISALALDVFLANQFVLVSSKHMSLKRLMQSSDIQIWSSNIKDFKQYRLHILLDFTAASVQDQAHSKDRCSFLICKDDLQHLVSIVELHNLNRRIGIKAVFQLHPQGPGYGTSSKMQRELLAPFKALQGLRNTLLFDRRVDALLVEELRTHMTHRIFWHRAHVRRLFAVLSRSKSAADEAFGERRFELAIQRYDNLRALVADALNHNIRILRQDDEVFWHNYHHLLLAIDYSHALCLLWSTLACDTPKSGISHMEQVLDISLDRNLDYNLRYSCRMYSGLLCCHIMACLMLCNMGELAIIFDRVKTFRRMDKQFRSALETLTKDLRKPSNNVNHSTTQTLSSCSRDCCHDNPLNACGVKVKAFQLL